MKDFNITFPNLDPVMGLPKTGTENPLPPGVAFIPGEFFLGSLPKNYLIDGGVFSPGGLTPLPTILPAPGYHPPSGGGGGGGGGGNDGNGGNGGSGGNGGNGGNGTSKIMVGLSIVAVFIVLALVVSKKKKVEKEKK